MNRKILAQVVSLVAFAGTILPAMLFFYKVIDLDTVKSAMMVATVAWFVATPLWMGRAHEAPSSGD
ncbi:MAG: hypothetical protein U0790_14660 [Isosphaeraceae bacterium]